MRKSPTILDRALSALGLARSSVWQQLSGGFQNIHFVNHNLSKVNVNARSANAFSAVYRCRQLIAGTIAGLPINIYRYDDKGKHRVENHAAYTLLTYSPDERITIREFVECIIDDAMAFGLGLAHIKRNAASGRTESVRYYPLGEWQVMDYTGPDPMYKGLKFYRHKDSSETLFPDDVFVMRGYMGLSIIQLHAQGIGIGIAAENQYANMLGKGLNFPGVVSTEATLAPEQKDAIKTWIQKHGGWDNVGVPVLDAGLKFTPTAMLPKDMEYLNTRKFQVEEVARMFGVPPTLLGIYEKAPYANAEEQDNAFVKYGLSYWISAFEKEAEFKLFAPGERNNLTIKINIRALLRGSMAAQAEFIDKLMMRGVLTINEARNLLDMNPVPGGDVNVLQVNQIALENFSDYSQKISNETAPA